jgi:hypothetical protein
MLEQAGFLPRIITERKHKDVEVALQALMDALVSEAASVTRHDPGNSERLG